MANPTTSAVYLHVIEDVMNKVREEFVNVGPGEAVLTELQGLWEMKMMQAGAVLDPSERPSVSRTVAAGGAGVAPVHDLNVPYEGPEEYETPTAEMLFPPTPLQTPLQTPIQTPLPGSLDSSLYNIPTGPSDYPTPISNEGASGNDIKPGTGRPSSYMQPPSPWMNQRPALGVDVNVAYVESREEPGRGISQSATQDFLTGPPGKRKRDDFAPLLQTGNFVPQQDGAGDADVFELEIIQSKYPGSTSSLNLTSGRVISLMQKGSPLRIPQLDGPLPDTYDDMLSTPNIYNYQGVVNEDYNVVNTPATNELQAGTPAIPVPNSVPDEDDDDEPPLNENDDDDLDDIDEGEELNTQHLVLAQFEKVTRTKSRWKCTLKDGIMHINKKDILFNKANGEFDF